MLARDVAPRDVSGSPGPRRLPVLVEALDGGILRWLAGLDVAQLNAARVTPSGERQMT